MSMKREFRSLVRFVTWKAYFGGRILTEHSLIYGTTKLLAEMYGYMPLTEGDFFKRLGQSL